MRKTGMTTCLGAVVKKVWTWRELKAKSHVAWNDPLHSVYPWLPKCIILKSVRFVYPGLNRSERDVDHSHSYDGEVKNEWSYTSTPPICLHGMDREHCTLFYITLLLGLFIFYDYCTLVIYILHIGAAWRHRLSGTTGGVFPLIMRPGLEMLGMKKIPYGSHSIPYDRYF